MKLNDLVSNAHVIVSATCTGLRSELDPERPRIVGTIASFDQVQTIRLNKDGTEAHESHLELAYLGGSVDDVHMGVCEMPRFTVGERYVLFLLNDGARYVSPIVGGEQGRFRLLRDGVSGIERVLDAGGFGIIGVDLVDLIRTNHPVTAVNDGWASGPRPRGSEAEEAALVPRSSSRVLSVEDFAVILRSVAHDEPTLDDWKDDTVDLPRLPDDITPDLPGNETQHMAGQRGPLGACLHQDVYIWFEQNDNVQGWDAFGDFSGIEDYGKAIWDVHMNIFSDDPNPTDGCEAGNGESEIVGWLTNNELSDYCGYSWGSALAKIIYWATSFDSGGEIIEADIMMRDGIAWTTDWNTAATSNAVNYRNAIVHELGHAWGYQAGNCYDETYNYAYPSVMHAYYYGQIWEDGREIHARDVSVYRNLYDNQTAIKTVVDLGVESYRALDGSSLQNSYAVPSAAPAGEPITVHRFTVENNSNSTQNDIHLRYYLSTNRSLSSSDHLVKDVALGNMVAVSRKIASNGHVLNTDGVPPGWYYIGAKVTRNGYDDDHRPANDVTWTTYQVQILPADDVGVPEEQGSVNAVVAFPNPTDGTVSIVVPEGVVEGTLMLYDPVSRALVQQRIGTRAYSGVVEVDMTALPVGMYVARIEAGDGQRYSTRVVRQ